MDGEAEEHVHEVARVLSRYADLIGVRAFPKFQKWEDDRQGPRPPGLRALRHRAGHQPGDHHPPLPGAGAGPDDEGAPRLPPGQEVRPHLDLPPAARSTPPSPTRRSSSPPSSAWTSPCSAPTRSTTSTSATSTPPARTPRRQRAALRHLVRHRPGLRGRGHGLRQELGRHPLLRPLGGREAHARRAPALHRRRAQDGADAGRPLLPLPPGAAQRQGDRRGDRLARARS